jgi:glycosyltransferase involved in cell wall biosynthesis
LEKGDRNFVNARRPRITIVTPTLNQGRFIEETIQSVVNQGYENLEYLVLDGGSADGTLEILKRYGDRLQWWSEKDNGQADENNMGQIKATGEILGYLNSDDLYEPGALSKVAAYFEKNPEVDMVYGEGYLINEDGSAKRRFPATEPEFDLWRLIHIWDYILQQSTFFRRRLLERIGFFNESLHYGLDWDFWIRAGKAGKVGYMAEFLGTLREYDSAKSFSGGFQRIKELYGVMHAHTGRRSPPPSIIIYGSDWIESALYRKLRWGLGGRLAGTAELSRKLLRGALGRYIARAHKRTSPLCNL